MSNFEPGELSGILVIDKPAGITSAKVVAHVKQLIGAKKAGHTGTLDPLATGVLVCCINRATRLAPFFLHGHKKYEAVLVLGVETDTQDATGNVTAAVEKVAFTEKTIHAAFKRFEGAMEQLPPVYSALKYKGTPLYKLARSNHPVQKPPRRVFILYNKVLEIRLPVIRFEVSCSAGTYIRTLCADIGTFLGCGAHLKELRRTQSSGFTLEEAATLPEIDAMAVSGRLSGRLIRMANALKDMPGYIADNVLLEKIRHGNIITKNDVRPERIDAPKNFIKIVDINEDLVAVVKYTKGKNRYDYCCVFK